MGDAPRRIVRRKVVKPPSPEQDAPSPNKRQVRRRVELTPAPTDSDQIEEGSMPNEKESETAEAPVAPPKPSRIGTWLVVIALVGVAALFYLRALEDDSAGAPVSNLDSPTTDTLPAGVPEPAVAAAPEPAVSDTVVPAPDGTLEAGTTSSADQEQTGIESEPAAPAATPSDAEPASVAETQTPRPGQFRDPDTTATPSHDAEATAAAPAASDDELKPAGAAAQAAAPRPLPADQMILLLDIFAPELTQRGAANSE